MAVASFVVTVAMLTERLVLEWMFDVPGKQSKGLESVVAATSFSLPYLTMPFVDTLAL